MFGRSREVAMGLGMGLRECRWSLGALQSVVVLARSDCRAVMDMAKMSLKKY